MDPSDHVRQALASVMNDMSPVLGRDHTINHLLPMLLSLLRDNNADVSSRARVLCVCVLNEGNDVSSTIYGDLKSLIKLY